MIGARARIGVVVPATNTASEYEFWPAVPAGVTLSFARAVSSRDPDPVRRLSAYREGALKGAVELAEVKPSLIVWACTSGSFIRGVGYDRELANAMGDAARVPVLTTSTALIAALKVLGVRKLAMGTPYPQDITDIERRFFEDSVPGLSVVNTAIIDIADPYSRGLITPEETDRLARRADVAEADAVLLSCTDLQSFAVIDALEQHLGKPVISSNLATLWAMFGKLRIEPRAAPGSLWKHAYAD
jgi:maleate isomerase